VSAQERPRGSPGALTHAQARAYYDRFGAKQDSQRFYESPALSELVHHGAFEEAHALFEVGCGTGYFAAALLEDHLPPDASYRGVDVSATMVALTRKRLARFGERAQVTQTGGEPTFDAADASMDRVVSTYVLDLLSTADIQAVLAEARRMLVPGGLLGLVSLTRGFTLSSRLVERVWTSVWRHSPSLVGGCRPISLVKLVDPSEWQVQHRRLVSSFGVPSEVLVAEKVVAGARSPTGEADS
jgi:SAM-dependent methyltransferase